MSLVDRLPALARGDVLVPERLALELELEAYEIRALCERLAEAGALKRLVAACCACCGETLKLFHRVPEPRPAECHCCGALGVDVLVPFSAYRVLALPLPQSALKRRRPSLLAERQA